MLSAEEKQEIEAELPHYKDRRSLCIDALRIIQKHRRWVSNEAIQEIADFLEMKPDQVDSVATFYNLIFRKPIGKHVLLLCDSAACWMLGEPSLRRLIQHRLGISLGETTADGRFTLLPIACLGACDRGPALMVDDQLYQDLDEIKLENILNQYSTD